jgi:hypothetical protein
MKKIKPEIMWGVYYPISGFSTKLFLSKISANDYLDCNNLNSGKVIQVKISPVERKKVKR